MISLRYFIVSCLWHTSLFREVASFYFGHLIILYVLALVQYVTIDPFLLLRTRTSNHLGTCEFKLYNWGGVWLGGVHTNKSREVRTEYTRNFVFVYLSSVSCESLVLAQNEFCFEKVCSYLGPWVFCTSRMTATENKSINTCNCAQEHSCKLYSRAKGSPIFATSGTWKAWYSSVGPPQAEDSHRVWHEDRQKDYSRTWSRLSTSKG